MTYRLPSALFATVLAIGVVAPAFAAPATVAAFDPDKDGTIDLKEAQAAASMKFDMLDPDKDGTLDAKELTGLMTAAEMKAADPDSDGTLDKKEYLAVVAARFKAADPDAEGTIDAKELSSPAGASLAMLLK
ncbi:hypothetical protein AFCDBAGC_4791 [Methylobacterium cerastii]|uniref:EF-hand domain-containing protein n=1 Tax=Methylobacterium cerastii TaxID=932741 RepID=A0ABQ4QNR0_9HYPH|nr:MULTISPECIES: EF-hand domain-containing protein [Methylobacterium]TXM72684.1 EF-hand domain-containing protein [Methylobacterium sp. WL12]TXN00859.1 EF-hand domain-containing protein [Methylobacterium sp. WL103]GJD46906.1 hypothetical protein AFCDBAGC_4791 [Methylobacterium cerastii]